MGLFIRQDESRSELQSKITAELQQKLRQTTADENTVEPEPRFLENQHATRPAGVLILILVVILIGVFVYYFATNQY